MLGELQEIYTEDARASVARIVSANTGFDIAPGELEWVDGCWSLDGMPAAEWADAMMEG
jgi:hypothetical protein